MSQAKHEEALLQTRAEFDSHVASGRNEHAQISSKLESETQTRTRLESEVLHVTIAMFDITDRKARSIVG